MGIVIKAENISKAYQLGQFSTGTLSQDLHRWWASLRGKEDPFLKIGETNDRTSKGDSNMVWSLKDINFEIEQGDAVGIIGRNGAGKSTLLKILSQVTSPTTGSLKVKGRIASLLEVGTGFHPELTGRENIFLNGAILGMRKHEITRKFEEIVDFSGVERYIDTPVKRYSSGMYVRLAFAVAAHLESEILIVDEVLAVGDAEFQKKCLGKMGQVRKGEGRTVLFVSHNMGSVKQLCNKGIVLNRGLLELNGTIKDAINYYTLNSYDCKSKSALQLLTKKHNDFDLLDFKINSSSDDKVELTSSNLLNIRFEGAVKQSFQLNIEIRIYTVDMTLVSFYSPGHFDGILRHIPEGEFVIQDIIELPEYMANGEYLMQVELCYPNVETYISLQGIRLVKSNITTATGRVLSYNDTGFFIMRSYNDKSSIKL